MVMVIIDNIDIFGHSNGDSNVIMTWRWWLIMMMMMMMVMIILTLVISNGEWLDEDDNANDNIDINDHSNGDSNGYNDLTTMMMMMIVMIILTLVISNSDSNDYNDLTTMIIDNRELKHQAFLLSRRPIGTKLSADVAYLNTLCFRGDRHGGLQASFCLRIGQNCKVYLSKEWLQAPNKSSITLCK